MHGISYVTLPSLRPNAGRSLLILILAFQAITAGAASLVLNGDFESGTTGFSSDYTFHSTDLTPEGRYTIASSANDVHGAWVDSGDHTSGSGDFFIANGSPDTSDVVWMTSDAISITQAGTAYRFEAYITSVYAVNNDGPILRFQVGNGTDWFDMGTSETFENGYTPGAWRLSYYDGVFDNPGTYYLRLMNDQNAAAGNDLGIDDIYFGLTSEAPSVEENPLGDYSEIPTDPVTDGGAAPEPGVISLGLVALAVLFGARRNSP